jgi:hypothetical protein
MAGLKQMLKFRDDELRLVGRSLTDVGPDKPVGYLPLYTFKAMGETGKRLREDAASRGLAVASFGPDECCVKSGAIYVYDREALSRELNRHTEALSAAGMPSDPDRFIAEIAAHWLDEAHPLMPLIASAFGETRPHPPTADEAGPA